jgi:AbrB family looped-hinge helix DNA binding protein
MATTRLSSKGQLIIPKEVRDRHGWHEGTELEVEDRGDVVVLRGAPRAFPSTAVEQVRGCLRYEGPPVPLERFDEAIGEEIAEAWQAFERRSR